MRKKWPDISNIQTTEVILYLFSMLQENKFTFFQEYKVMLILNHFWNLKLSSALEGALKPVFPSWPPPSLTVHAHFV